jgi:sugar lactone lactonase YvrE
MYKVSHAEPEKSHQHAASWLVPTAHKGYSVKQTGLTNQMKRSLFKISVLRFSTLALVLLLGGAIAHAADDDCQAAGEYGFVCGPQNAEDLVRIPDTGWIIASGMAPTAAIYLVDSKEKTWSELYPGDAPRAVQDMQTYGACPGSPDPNAFASHGLNLRPGADGHSTLYVVGHGGREAIEVFDVDASGAEPVLTWTGCVMTPDGMEANSVASLRDGSLLATIPLHAGLTIPDAMAQKITGAVYAWSPGDSGFTRVEGTGLPYGNGIEVSADESEFYVASSGLFTVVAFSNSNPARQLRSSVELSIVPDNLHMGPDGSLITAGLVADDPECGNVRGPGEFDLEAFASCPRPFIVTAVDPQSLEVRELARGPANAKFSNITMALPMGDELWIGTFAGDRIAYRSRQE